MVKTGQDTSFFAGERKTLEFYIVDEDAAGAPPLNLTSAFSELKWALSTINPQSGQVSATPILEKKSSVAQPATGGDQIDIVNGDGTDDVAQVQLVGADTATLLGDFHMQLSGFDGNGEEQMLATGTLTLERNVVNT